MKKNKKITNQKSISKTGAISAIADCDKFMLITNNQIVFCANGKEDVLALIATLMHSLVEDGTVTISDLKYCVKIVRESIYIF